MKTKEFIERVPDACEDDQREILQHETMREWWMDTARADLMLLCVERVAAARDMYACDDLAHIWAARAEARAAEAAAATAAAATAALEVRFVAAAYWAASAWVEFLQMADDVRERIECPF